MTKEKDGWGVRQNGKLIPDHLGGDKFKVIFGVEKMSW